MIPVLPEPASPMTKESGTLNAPERSRQGMALTKRRHTVNKQLEANKSFTGTVIAGIVSLPAPLAYFRCQISHAKMPDNTSTTVKPTQSSQPSTEITVSNLFNEAFKGI